MDKPFDDIFKYLRYFSENIERKYRDVLNLDRTIKNDDFFLVLLKKWNSSSPKYPLNRLPEFRNYFKYDYSIGGGYFLVLGGYGLIIDPGYKYLENFYENGFVPRDINGIFISHCHDDHCIDLESIFSIINKANKDLSPNDKIKIDLFINSSVYKKYKLMLQNDKDIIRGKINITNSRNNFKFKNINDEIIEFKFLNTYHKESPWCKKKNKGRGLTIRYKNKKLLYTGDSEINEDLDIYNEDFCDVILVNIGKIGKLPPETTKNHLGLNGVREILDHFAEKNYFLQKIVLILTEMGIELKDSRLQLVSFIREYFKNNFRNSFPLDVLYSEPGTIIDLNFNSIITRMSINLNDLENYHRIKMELNICVRDSLYCQSIKRKRLNLANNQILDIAKELNSNRIKDNTIYIPRKQYFFLDNTVKKIEKIIYTKIDNINDVDAKKFNRHFKNKNDLIHYLKNNYIFTPDSYITLLEYETLTE